MNSKKSIDFGSLSSLAEEIFALAKGASESIRLTDLIEKYNVERIGLIQKALEQNNQRICGLML